MDNISELIKELDKAVLCGNTEKADEISEKLFQLQGGMEVDTIMPDQFFEKIEEKINQKSGGQKSMNIKKIIGMVAIAAVITAFGITAMATRWYGIKDMVFNNINTDTENTGESNSTAKPDTQIFVDDTLEKTDFIAMQGYPDSKEYKASVEWNLFCAGYDTDHKLLDAVGNKSNEVTEKYPMYLVYTQEMADKLEEIVTKYGLTLHQSITVFGNREELINIAGTGNFIGNTNIVLGGYIFDDGTFSYDGDAVTKNGTRISYQLRNDVKGTFSDTILNIGNANDYKEWIYKTSCGVEVSLALGKNKSLVIVDLEKSYIVMNVLSGTEVNAYSSEVITAEDLQEFADTFDYSKIN